MKSSSAALPSRPRIRGEVPTWKLAIQRIGQMRDLYHDWPSALLDRCRVRPSDRLHTYLVRVDGKRFRLLARRDGYDIRAINELWIGRVYDRWTKLLDPPSVHTVVDVGANCGYFSVLAGGLLGAREILAVEPDPDNVCLLNGNLGLNGIAATVAPFAVMPSPCPRSVQLYRSRDSRLHSVLFEGDRRTSAIPRPALDEAVAEVPARLLGDLIEQRFGTGVDIDLLKVDIEGVEWDVLGSLSDAQLLRIRCVVVESDVPVPDSITTRLDKLGFDQFADAVYLAAIRRP